MQENTARAIVGSRPSLGVQPHLFERMRELL